MAEEANPEVVEMDGQKCPICGKNGLKLTEFEREIPYFGNVFIFSMQCKECKYHKSDVEPSEQGDPAKYTLEINGEDDMSIRIVKSSHATIKIPRITTIEPGAASNGYVTNVEGILNRVKVQLESVRDNAEEKSDRKKAKNMLKKIQNTMWGQDTLKLILEDQTGNSSIISEKASKDKLKKK